VSWLLVGPQNEALDQTDFQTNRASGKAKSYIQSVLVQRTMGGHQMRRELQAPKGAETLTYSFHFQISNKGGRQACSVEVQAPNFQDATTFFRQNFPQIEFMARDHLANGIGDRRPIKLAALGDPNVRAERRGRLAHQRRPRKSGNGSNGVEQSLSWQRASVRGGCASLVFSALEGLEGPKTEQGDGPVHLKKAKALDPIAT
jgi:hypothetical protein